MLLGATIHPGRTPIWMVWGYLCIYLGFPSFCYVLPRNAAGRTTTTTSSTAPRLRTRMECNTNHPGSIQCVCAHNIRYYARRSASIHIALRTNAHCRMYTSNAHRTQHTAHCTAVREAPRQAGSVAQAPRGAPRVVGSRPRRQGRGPAISCGAVRALT